MLTYGDGVSTMNPSTTTEKLEIKTFENKYNSEIEDFEVEDFQFQETTKKYKIYRNTSTESQRKMIETTTQKEGSNVGA